MCKTKSATHEAVHSMRTKGPHAVGVMKQVTLRKCNRLCLPLNLRCRQSLMDTESIHDGKSAASDTYR